MESWLTQKQLGGGATDPSHGAESAEEALLRRSSGGLPEELFEGRPAGTSLWVVWTDSVPQLAWKHVRPHWLSWWKWLGSEKTESLC